MTQFIFEDVEQGDDAAETLYRVIGRVSINPLSLFKKKNRQGLKLVFDQVVKQHPDLKGKVEELKDVLNGVVKKVGSDVTGASKGQLPSWVGKELKDQLGPLAGVFKKFAGMPENRKRKMSDFKRVFFEANMSDMQEAMSDETIQKLDDFIDSLEADWLAMYDEGDPSMNAGEEGGPQGPDDWHTQVVNMTSPLFDEISDLVDEYHQDLVGGAGYQPSTPPLSRDFGRTGR